MTKIERTSKKIVNKVIVGTCVGVDVLAGSVELVASCGEFACWGVRQTARIVERCAEAAIDAGGIFEIDEEDLKEKAEIILEKY